MPYRRKHADGNHRGLASYFYDAQGDGLAPLPQSSRVSTGKLAVQQPTPAAASFLSGWKNGKWEGPDPEPAGGPPKRSHRSRSVTPAGGERARHSSASRPPRVKKAKPAGAAHSGEMNQTRHKHKEGMKQSAADMKEHFKESDKIFAEHESWPLHGTYLQINAHIQQCKTDIAEVRAEHAAPGQHKESVEAVHSTRIDIGNWHTGTMYDTLERESADHHVHLRLLLRHPRDEHDSNYVYVNVALAWLFAAKRQLMAIVEADVEQMADKTPRMEAFVKACKEGRQAREQYLTHKNFLGVKKHKNKYHLEDQEDLAYQHDRFIHPHP